MKTRKKVIPPKLRNYFRFEEAYGSLNTNLYFNVQIFNGFTFFVALTLLSAVFGFYKPLFWSLSVSCLLLLTFLYYKTLRLCNGLILIREAPLYAREKTQIKIIYTISNETAFSILGINFDDQFEGVDKGSLKVKVPTIIPAHTQIKHEHIIKLDAGMGIKVFMPIKINFRDELGIFDFQIEFQQNQEIEVYPYIEDTPYYKNSISPESIEYGFYEIAKRGDSNLFIGTREYRRGDPVKHINWKLTKKSNQVVVNEFEKSTNTYITILLELDLKHQIGFGEISTWEMAKDLAISICHNEIRKNNLIQVIANNLYIPFGSGQKQLTLFEKYFTNHTLKNSEADAFSRHLGDLPSQSQVYFICPNILTVDIRQTIEQLKKLKDLGHKVIIFTLNPLKELSSTMQGKQKLILLEMQRHSENEVMSVFNLLASHGIPVIPITIKKDLRLHDQLVELSKELIEIK